MRDAFARPEREPQSRLEIDESDGSVFELVPDDAVRREAKPIAIERRDFSKSSTPMVMTVIRGFMSVSVIVL